MQCLSRQSPGLRNPGLQPCLRCTVPGRLDLARLIGMRIEQAVWIYPGQFKTPQNLGYDHLYELGLHIVGAGAQAQANA